MCTFKESTGPQYSIFLFILMIAQLSLVVYMFIAKEDYLKHMEHVVDKAWDRRTQKADYMDGLQIGVSSLLIYYSF